MMKRAQGHAVVRSIWSAGRMPLDVCGIEPQIRIPESRVVPANCTAMIVDTQNFRAEPRISPSCRHRPLKVHRIQDRVVQRLGEALLQKYFRRTVYKSGWLRRIVKNGSRKPAFAWP